ncbi:MAG: MATE family efflux transporter [Clostridiales bacterium]|jgi:Na+-driven multidrug efflux pump|nr:MATE family efflux transporter [Clostridiales bacterium]
MPKRYYGKKAKYARVVSQAVKESPKAAESIARTPTKGHLLKFALPTVLSMLIMSTFGIVDGIFVSRLVDQAALAATTIIFPFLAFVLAVGFMLGVGGNALIAKKIGAGQKEEGRQNFSLIVLVAFIVSIIIAIVGIAFPSFIINNILGADDFIYPMALTYLQPLLYFMPAIVLGMVFTQFLITEGKAHISAIVSLASGLTSAGLNYVFIYLMDLGLQGAALATSIGYTLPAIVGLAYFTFMRGGNLYFVRPRLDFRALGRTCINGASEMVSMLATSVTATIMNNILMRIHGFEAAAAAAIIFAGFGIFTSLFIGYSSGIAPIVSYNFGKEDADNLKLAFKNSLRILGIVSVAAIALAWLSTDLLLRVYDIPAASPIHEMTTQGLRIISVGFVFMALNTFGSMFFTALNNGLVSTTISFFAAFVFVAAAYAVLPAIFGVTGAWMSIPAAETLAIGVTIFFLLKMRKRYNYA